MSVALCSDLFMQMVIKSLLSKSDKHVNMSFKIIIFYTIAASLNGLNALRCQVC